MFPKTIFRVASVLLILVGFQAQAGFTTISTLVSGNDCHGMFNSQATGGNFNTCGIAALNDNGERVEVSPVIAKFNGAVVNDANKSFSDINSSFSGLISPSDFSFSAGADKTGTWTSSNTDVGIRFWTAKGSNSFNLFWTVDDTTLASGGVCETNLLSLGCLSAAQVVTTGSWFTPVNGGGNRAGLSHITFFNGGGRDGRCTENCDSTSVPEPSTLALFGLLALGFAWRTRA